jgi:hypothetical protein
VAYKRDFQPTYSFFPIRARSHPFAKKCSLFVK